MMEMFYLSAVQYTVAASNVWLLSTWNVASVTEEPNFSFHFILPK